jgi:hypothetical protein
MPKDGLRLLAVSIFSILGCTSAIGEAAPPERVFQLQSITDVPCEAWVKQPDGSWLQAPNTMIVLPGNTRIGGTRVTGIPASFLNRKCAK